MVDRQRIFVHLFRMFFRTPPLGVGSAIFRVSVHVLFFLQEPPLGLGFEIAEKRHPFA